MNIIIPKTLVPLESYQGSRLYFLAGPLRGGGDWQHSMARLLTHTASGCVIAIPQRYEPPHELCPYIMQGTLNAFERQLAWEDHYLNLASKSGGIIFWLGCQKEPRTDADPYAMDTRREIGEWLARARFEPGVRVFVGAEEEFRGLSQIERAGKRLLGEEFCVHRSMRSLVRVASQGPR